MPSKLLHAVSVLAVLIATHSAARAEQRYAVIIGSNAGWSQDRPLRYAENDAERMRDVLVALGGFAPDRVELLRDPDTAAVRSALRRLTQIARTSTDDTLVFFYYSGHADAAHLHLRGEPLTHRELRDTLRAVPSTKLAVIDACKSGSVTRKGGSPTDEFAVDLDRNELSGLAIVTSSGADELSQETRALQGSVFTHHLVSGLRGAADVDGDLQVTLAEAYHHAYARTRADTAVTGVPQRPAFLFELRGQGDLVLTRLQTSRGALIVPRGVPQRYVVLDEHEWRLIAEALAEPSRDVTLSLQPGTYRVKRVAADALEVAALTIAAGERADAGQLRYARAPLASGIVKADPSELDPVERRELARSRAFGLLAAGQAAAALAIFDELLRGQPSDALAWRGRGRALVRLAEAYQQVGDRPRERRALGDALVADPSLADDPTFQLWYRRLSELDGRAHATLEAKQAFEQSVASNPRTARRYGVGFDVFSARGLLAVTGTRVVHRMVFPSIAVDLANPGFDLEVKLAPVSSRWSPYVGVGAHVTLKKLGVLETSGTRVVDNNDPTFSSDEMWGAHARIEVGAQLVGRSGFTTELGLAIINFRADRGDIVQQFWPVFHFGWLW